MRIGSAGVVVLVMALPGCGGGETTGHDGTTSGSSDTTSSTATSTTTVAPTTVAPTTVAPTTSATSTSDGSDSGSTTAPLPDVGTGRPPVDPPVYGIFAWPVDAWISATDFYETGAEHSGSADLSAAYWMPVGAARGGTVAAAQWTTIGGYLVRIDHGDGYETVYSHLVEPPLVEVGDVVATNDVIGYLGRTGNAFRGGAHVHFGIELDDERLVIPGIDYGDWVTRGQPIAGDYPGLTEEELPQYTRDMRVVVPQLSVHAGPDQQQPIVATLDEGDVVTATGSSAGYYRIAVGNEWAYIVHAGTQPVDSTVFGVEVSTSTPVLEEPDAGATQLGTLDTGDLVTVFETMNGHHRFLFGLPTTYAWIAAADTVATEAFSARIRAPSANLRAGPGIDHRVVGNLEIFDAFTVVEVDRGWYRLESPADTWVAGWLTSGRL